MHVLKKSDSARAHAWVLRMIHTVCAFTYKDGATPSRNDEMLQYRSNGRDVLQRCAARHIKHRILSNPRRYI